MLQVCECELEGRRFETGILFVGHVVRCGALRQRKRTGGRAPKNQIVVNAECLNGQSYTFVINGMSKTGNVDESTRGVVVNSTLSNTATFRTGSW